MNQQRAYFVIVLALIISSCSPTEVAEQTIHEKLQTILDEVFTEYNGEGISAAVVFPDESAWLGTAHVDGSEPVYSSDLFVIGSITKMYTATVILQLIEEGLLNFDDNINQFLPSYDNIDGNITIKQLLLHTAGVYDFPNHPNYSEMLDEDNSKIWSPDELVTRMFLEPYFAPGEGWRYSSGNYTLLGMIIAEITGNRVSKDFRDRLYHPLGLTSTFLDCEETITGDIANFWFDVDDDGVPEDISIPFEMRAAEVSIAYTSGGLFATAEDCARFTHALLRGDILNSDSMDQMLDWYTDLPEGWSNRGYGLGIELLRYSMVNGAEAYGHGGNFYHIAATAYLPEYDVSITTLLNSQNWALWEKMMNALCQVVMEYYEQ
ncbi:MAG: serine hydrolase domain-containing protein [Candidatus Neomarinimicrobiota bacterium]